jgi:hypothetical protein
MQPSLDASFECLFNAMVDFCGSALAFGSKYTAGQVQLHLQSCDTRRRAPLKRREEMLLRSVDRLSISKEEPTPLAFISNGEIE